MRRSASARSASRPCDDGRHVYHMYVVRSSDRDRIAEALTGAGDLLRLVLRHAVAPPARAPLPRLGAGVAARDRAGCAGEPRSPDVGGDRRGDPGAGRERRPGQPSPWGRRADAPADQPASPLATRRRRLPVRRRLVPRLPAALRPAGPALLPHALHQDDLDRDPDPGRGLRPLRLLQPLVALRLDPRHVGRRARRHGRLPRLQRSSSTSPIRSRRCACRARSR